ncbi:hypothetical protein BBP40_004246 [Aspergillus hancockii]|nr:hypothetical protein BBP40_004246 [Aspergillus hancockii]
MADLSIILYMSLSETSGMLRMIRLPQNYYQSDSFLVENGAWRRPGSTSLHSLKKARPYAEQSSNKLPVLDERIDWNKVRAWLDRPYSPREGNIDSKRPEKLKVIDVLKNRVIEGPPSLNISLSAMYTARQKQ